MTLRSRRFPDPVVSANVYCAGALDGVLLHVLVPLRRRLREMAGAEVSLWAVRYARRGEHLKVRIHGPDGIAEEAREALRRAAGAFLAALGPPPDGPRKVRPDEPPIDEEDRAPEAAPDRSLLFTRYGRSPVSLGGEPFLREDEYRALMTACLGRGCDLVLDLLEEGGEIPTHGQRQKLLLKALLSGLAALRLPREKTAAYLAYHRDWLIRFPLRAGGDARRAAEALDLLDRRAGAAAATTTALHRATAGWGGTEPAAPATEPWPRSVADLAGYLAGFRHAPEDRRLDPFAEDPAFGPLFKAFHGLANQLGLKTLDEAYAHHLLLCSSAGAGSDRYRSVALIPPGTPS